MLVCSLTMATEAGGQSDRAVEAAAFSLVVEAVTFSVAVGVAVTKRTKVPALYAFTGDLEQQISCHSIENFL